MTHVELTDWMEQMDATQETLEALQMHNMDGSELVHCLNSKKREKEDAQITIVQLKMTGSPMMRMQMQSRIESEVAQEDKIERNQERSSSQAR